MLIEISENEYKLIQKVREMKPREELVLRKQTPDNPKEYVVFITTMTLFGREVDKES